MQAPESVMTQRLILRRPQPDDLEAIFTRYACDPEVTRFLSWPTHGSLDDSRAFLAFSDAEWARRGAGPYLVLARDDGRVLGSSGLGIETPYRASTGYVLARDAWGRGYATEALRAIVDLAQALAVRRLYALCHVEHAASWRVLERCGFLREGTLSRHTEFPNLDASGPCDVFCYSRVF